MFAQPLLVSGFKMMDGRDHDVIVVATGKNLVYAFDANTYEPLWPKNQPVSLGLAQTTMDIGCADVKKEYGISSTPVIVRKAKDSATLYVVSATEPSKGEFHTFIHALNLPRAKIDIHLERSRLRRRLQMGQTLNSTPKTSGAGLALLTIMVAYS